MLPNIWQCWHSAGKEHGAGGETMSSACPVPTLQCGGRLPAHLKLLCLSQGPGVEQEWCVPSTLCSNTLCSHLAPSRSVVFLSLLCLSPN